MKKNRFFVAAILIIILLGICLSACRTEKKDPNTLWILADSDNADYGKIWHIKKIVRSFRAAHPELNIELEFLPYETLFSPSPERAARIEKIRTEIIAGRGPDIYLLSNETPLCNPIFKDVKQAMYNGVFADISAYYDSDEALEKEQLNAAVMDAGIVNGARYVLPLYYNMDVLYTDRALMEATGIDLEAASNLSGLLKLLETADWYWYAIGDETLGLSALLPELIDYSSGKLLISKDEMEEFLRILGQWRAKNPNMLHKYVNISTYLHSGLYFSEELPFNISNLHYAPSIAAIAKAQNRDLVAIPVRGMDGTITASISAFAAVGSSCIHQDVAYSIVRAFLTETKQFQSELIQAGGANCQIFSGIPVRSIGSEEAIWKMHKNINKKWSSPIQEVTQRKAALMAVILEDGDIPILNIPIDRVHFATTYDWSVLSEGISRVVDGENVSAVAKDLIYQLNLHAAEG